MTAPGSVPLHVLAEDNLTAASPDLLRAMVKTLADARMSAKADVLRNAEYGQVSDERFNHRDGYCPRERVTRAGAVELAIPELGQGSYYPHWLLERRRRAWQARISVIAHAYLLGVSTRRVEKPAESPGVTRDRPPGRGPCPPDVFTAHALWIRGASVRSVMSSAVTPGAHSTSARPSGVTSRTPRSVMIRWTHRSPVSGRVHSLTIFGVPSFAVCSIRVMTRRAPWTSPSCRPCP